MVRAKEAVYYSFDVSIIEEIFDMLLANVQIKLTEGQNILTKDELVEKKYCK